MRLNGTQRKQLYTAIVSAFTRSDLILLVSLELNQNLETIVSGSTLSEIVLNLITYTENYGITENFIKAIIAERPSHLAVQNLVSLLSKLKDNSQKISKNLPKTSKSTDSVPQKTLSVTKQNKHPLKVFISYAHKDEFFKDELVVMLASLQRQGTIDAWQDRLIEPGDEWYQSIQGAMNTCDLALLLVSKNFLASRFINDEEVPKLMIRRKNEGVRIIPIIIRPCPWDTDPFLKKMQALPKDGKPVITFPEATGERDQVWTDIAKAIAATDCS